MFLKIKRFFFPKGNSFIDQKYEKQKHENLDRNIFCVFLFLVLLGFFLFFTVEVIYNWMHCFPISTGTPESDTVCKSCPEGFFSNETSSRAACRKHTNCTALGFKTALKGNAVRDNICQENTETTPQKCGIGMCHIKEECSKNTPLIIVKINVSAFMTKFSSLLAICLQCDGHSRVVITVGQTKWNREQQQYKNTSLVSFSNIFYHPCCLLFFEISRVTDQNN